MIKTVIWETIIIYGKQRYRVTKSGSWSALFWGWYPDSSNKPSWRWLPISQDKVPLKVVGLGELILEI